MKQLHSLVANKIYTNMSSVHRIVCMKRKFRFEQHKVQQKTQKGGLCNVTGKVISAKVCYRITEILPALSLVDSFVIRFARVSEKYFIKAIWNWENFQELCTPSTASRVCINEFSEPLLVFS